MSGLLKKKGTHFVIEVAILILLNHTWGVIVYLLSVSLSFQLLKATE